MHIGRPLALLVLVGCGKTTEAGAGAPHSEAAATTESIRVRFKEKGGNNVAATIHNKSGGIVKLSRDLKVETIGDGGAWAPVAASNLYIREKCTVEGSTALYEPPACVEITSGKVLETAPWTGMIGDAQCACEECGPVPKGKYRFVVSSCDGATKIMSEPFDVAGR